MAEVGKFIIIIGIFLILFGFMLSSKIPFFGKLPGDIFIQKNGFSFYFPLATSIILSIVIGILLSLFKK